MLFPALFAFPVAFILAQAETCPAPEPAAVHVELHAADAELDTSMSSKELTAGFDGRRLLDKNIIREEFHGIGGLAESSIQANYTREFVQVPVPGGICLSVPRVEVDIVYTPRIYVGSDIVGKECWYDKIFAHEQRHIGTDMKTINDLTPRIRELAEETLAEAAEKNSRLLQPGQSYDAMVDIDNRLNKVIQTFYDEYTALREKRHAEFDNNENYAYEQGLCEGR